MMYNNYKFKNVFERVIALNCCKIYAPKISYYHISFALTKRVFISRIYAVFWLKLLICIYLKTDKFCLLYLIFASCFNSEFLHTLFFLLHINIMKDALATFLKLSDICLRSSSLPQCTSLNRYDMRRVEILFKEQCSLKLFTHFSCGGNSCLFLSKRKYMHRHK